MSLYSRWVHATGTTLAAGIVLALSACSGGSTDATDAQAGATGTPSAASSEMIVIPVLDPNTATAEQLAGVPGMDAETANAVVAGKPYATATALNKKLLEKLPESRASTVLAHVFVPVNLNTADEADIRLIPGMTDKMVHEFEEYRPYADMSVFDREIGKYVDPAEVARLRRYVTL